MECDKAKFDELIHKAATTTFPPKRRKYHYAAKIRPDGAVSALCFNSPRAINLRQAFWTTDKSAVTCKKCLELLPLLENGE